MPLLCPRKVDQCSYREWLGLCCSEAGPLWNYQELKVAANGACLMAFRLPVLWAWKKVEWLAKCRYELALASELCNIG